MAAWFAPPSFAAAAAPTPSSFAFFGAAAAPPAPPTAQQYFEQKLGCAATKVGDSGYRSTPIFLIEKDGPYTPADLDLASTLRTQWEPKHLKNQYMTYGSAKPEQRTPYAAVDNVCLLYDARKGMTEPGLCCGEWRKPVSCYGGAEKPLHGLVVAGGGHHERCGRRGDGTGIGSNGGWEKGHPNGRAAADTELIEEMRIDRRLVTVTIPFAFMDDVRNDPRAHYIRTIFLRWIMVDPKSSEELKKIHAIPVSTLPALLAGQQPIHATDGTELHFLLNHDALIRMLFQHPFVQRFVNLIGEYSHVLNSGGGGAAAPTFGIGSSAPPYSPSATPFGATLPSDSVRTF